MHATVEPAANPTATDLAFGPRLVLAFVRIAMGLMWFQQTLWKLPPNFGREGDEGGLWHFLKLEVAYPTFGFYKSFVENVIMPNYTVIGYQVYFGELFIAISLVFGLVTRLGALMGTLMGLNLLVGLYNVPGEWWWSYAFIVLLDLVLLVTTAGRTLGVDQVLRSTLHLDTATTGWRRVLAWLT